MEGKGKKGGRGGKTRREEVCEGERGAGRRKEGGMKGGRKKGGRRKNEGGRKGWREPEY